MADVAFDLHHARLAHAGHRATGRSGAVVQGAGAVGHRAMRMAVAVVVVVRVVVVMRVVMPVRVHRAVGVHVAVRMFVAVGVSRVMRMAVHGAIGMAVRVLARRTFAFTFDFTFDSSLAFATAADGAHGVSPENQAI